MNKAEEYYDSGVEKANSGDYEGAIEDYNKAIEINPKDADAYHNRGFAKAELGNYYVFKDIYFIIPYVPYILAQRVILTIYRLSMLYVGRFPLYFRYIIFLFLGTIKINSWSLLHLQGL